MKKKVFFIIVSTLILNFNTFAINTDSIPIPSDSKFYTVVKNDYQEYDTVIFDYVVFLADNNDSFYIAYSDKTTSVSDAPTYYFYNGGLGSALYDRLDVQCLYVKDNVVIGTDVLSYANAIGLTDVLYSTVDVHYFNGQTFSVFYTADTNTPVDPEDPTNPDGTTAEQLEHIIEQLNDIQEVAIYHANFLELCLFLIALVICLAVLIPIFKLIF